MEVKPINIIPNTGATPTTRNEAIKDTINSIINDTKAQQNFGKFMDNTQPMVTNWYHINKKESVYGLGIQDSAGPYEGGIKYDLIKNYIAYGFTDERGVDVAKGDYMQKRFEPQDYILIHLPDTLIPFEDDRLTLAIENHEVMYKVKSSVPVTFKNKPFIRTEITRCKVAPLHMGPQDFIDKGILVNTYEYMDDNVGTGKSPFMTTTPDGKPVKELLTGLNTMKTELNSRINDLFYKEDKNVYTSFDRMRPGVEAYIPMITDLQMEFRPLWTYGVNTILTHETLNNEMSKFSYKDSPLREFLLKREGALDILKKDGLDFSLYEYNGELTNPTYKIQSYLNDGRRYLIYDYYHGQDNYCPPTPDYHDSYIDNSSGDLCPNLWFTIDNKHNEKIPEKYMNIMEKWYNGTLTASELSDFILHNKFYPTPMDMLMNVVISIILDDIIKNNSAGVKLS